MLRRRLIARCLVVTTAVAAVGYGACSSFSGDDGANDTSDAGSDADGSSAPEAAVDASIADAPTSTYATEVLADKPIAYWRMGSRSGGTIPDEMGSSNMLSIVGSGHRLGVEGAVLGDDDTAIHFGADGYARAADSTPFHFPKNAPFTIEFWAKRDAVDGGEYYEYLVSVADGNGSNNRNGWGIYIIPSLGGNSSHFETYAIDGGELGSAARHVANGQWGQYVAVVDANKKMTLYIDGVPGSTTTVISMPNTTADLVVGAQNGGFRFFPGTIDEVSIYDKPLPAGRIDAHRHAARP